MSKTLESHLIEKRIYDRVIIRRTTWDGCSNEQEYGPDGDRHITPTIEFGYRPGISRKYIYQGTRIMNKQAPYGGDDLSCLVAEYTEDVHSISSESGEGES